MTYRIKGTLKLPDGAPAANCEIEFVSRKNFSPLVQGAKTNILTSATGAYDVTLELGEYAVIVYTGSTYPAQAGTITLSADTTPELDLPSLLNRSDWVPATPEYMQQIEAWLVSSGEYAASAENSAQSAAESAASIAGAISAHEEKAGAHSIAGVSGLQVALDGKEASGAASSAVSAHKTESDAHAIEKITGLRSELNALASGSNLEGKLVANGQTIDQIGMQTSIHHSGRVGYSSLPRLVKAFTEYNDATASVIQVLGLGSSVGNGASLPDPATQAPVKYLTSRLNAKFNKLGNKVITGYNRSVDGSTLTNGPTALANALAEPLTPKLVVLAFGMNDGGTAIYNAGQTYPYVYRRTVEIIEKSKAAGSDVVILTTPHPHSQRNTWSMPPGVAQIYPTSVAAPVADSALVPTVANSIKNIDATGNGTVIPVSYRHMRVNEAMRRAAADCGVPVIDAEWYWFKAVGDKGEDALFNTGEILHPNLLGHQLSYWAAIDDFVDSLTASVISGNKQSDFQPRVVTGISEAQAPLARNHLRQSSLATSEKALRVDNAAGNRGFDVDENGNIAPIETINSEWTFPRKTRKNIIYPSGTPKGYSGESLDMTFNISASTSIYTTKADGVSELLIKATNAGIGAGWQIVKYMVNNKAGVLTLQSMLSMGDAIITVSASGADIRVIPSAGNTNILFEVRELYTTS